MELGIKESKEALIGLLEISIAAAEILKDGAQLSDIGELWSKFSDDEKFKEALANAWEGAKAVPAELKDLSISESVELVALILPYVPKFIDILKKK